MRTALSFALIALFVGCGTESPSASDGVGSNTNWFRSCDQDVDCGDELSCICGACSQLCSNDSDCAELDDAVCPIDIDEFRARCEQDGGDELTFEGAACVPACSSDSDCPGNSICDDQHCSTPGACDQVAVIELSASTPELRARVGALFGSDYYVPTLFDSMPVGYTEPVEPARITATLLDIDGAPVEGCQVRLTPGAESGQVYAEALLSDGGGEVSALWMAGPGATQSLSASIEGRAGTISAEIEGTAIDFAEVPQATGAEARSSTHRAAVIVDPDVAPGASEISLEVTPVTFPARAAYIPLDTDFLGLALWNRSEQDAAGTNLTAAQRTLDIRANAVGGVDASVVYSTGSCSADAESAICTIEDAWTLGELISITVSKRELSQGETPADYDAMTHSQDPCLGANGCTDFTVNLQRDGGSVQLLAVMRVPELDPLTEQKMYLSHEKGTTVGEAVTCLDTQLSQMIVRHSTGPELALVETTRAESYGAYISWQNQTCANYTATLDERGFLLSSGGSNIESTPNFPGETRVVETTSGDPQ
jgi:hypothetical protein